MRGERYHQREKIMRVMIAAALLVAFAASASAQEFYVVQNTQDKRCNVVKGKPDPQKYTQVDPKAYATEREAKEARKAVAACPNK